MLNYAEKIGCGLSRCTLPVFSTRMINVENIVSMVGMPASFRIEHLPNTSRKIQRLPHLVFFVYLRLREYP